jgi:hypothetical protein
MRSADFFKDDQGSPAAFPSVGGMTSLGMEAIQIAALAQIKSSIEVELNRQQQAWKAPDRYFADYFGHKYRETILELPVRYYPGVRMGVLDLPEDAFPAVSAMVDRAAPRPGTDGSSGSSEYTDSLWIEVIVRSDQFLHGDAEERIAEEGTVDRRAKRTLDAVAQCLQVDPNLGGITQLAPPVASQGEPFLMKNKQPGEQTKERVFSLVRLDYGLPTYPSHRDSSNPPPDVLPRGFGEN